MLRQFSLCGLALQQQPNSHAQRATGAGMDKAVCDGVPTGSVTTANFVMVS